MAYTKIWEIAERLDTSIAYIVNEKKTENGDARYVTCWNCNQNNPYHSMMMTKNLFHKTDTKRIGFHATQSFAPGEGTPEMIHEIGLKWAKELFGDRYEFVLTTHVDKEHLHNHLIINSTSFVDGKQFTNSKKDRHRMMEVNDRLCKEYGLNIIENPQFTNSKDKRVYKLRRYFDEIRKDIDEAIPHSKTTKLFIRNMMMEGYDFKNVDGIDCVIHPYCDIPIPLNKLGSKYNFDKIIERILDEEPIVKTKKQSEIIIKLYWDYRDKKLGFGLQYLYIDWMVRLGILPNHEIKKIQKLSKEIRKELKQLDEISNEVILMGKYNIHTLEDLNSTKQEFQKELEELLNLRNGCYKERRKTKNLVEQEKISEKAKSYTPRIKVLRNQIKILNKIDYRYMMLEEQRKQLEKIQIKKNKNER